MLSYGKLTLTWALLMALTVAGMTAGVREQALGLAGTGAVLAIAGLKALQVMRNYLGLRRAGGGWQALFCAWLLLVGAVVLGAYAAAAFGFLPHHT